MTGEQRKTRLKIWSLVLTVFLLGCVTGGSLSAYRMQASSSSWHFENRPNKPQPYSQEAFEILKRDLELDEQQSKAVETVVERTRSEYRALKTEVRPRYDALRQTARAQIRAVLNDQQQQRFNAIVAKQDADREKGER